MELSTSTGYTTCSTCTYTKGFINIVYDYEVCRGFVHMDAALHN